LTPVKPIQFGKKIERAAHANDGSPHKMNTMKMKSNEKFFDNMKKMIKDGGVWQGDDAMMFKNKEWYYASFENYMYMKQIVSAKWLADNVVLLVNFPGSGLSDRDLFNSLSKTMA
jgi:hypothetical protein